MEIHKKFKQFLREIYEILSKKGVNFMNFQLKIHTLPKHSLNFREFFPNF